MLTRAEAGLIVRPNSELALLTEWDLRETFPALRRGLAAFNAGMYFADLVQRFVHDHDPHAGLYDALLAALRGLDVEVLAGVLTFQWAVLHEAGFRPILGDPDSGSDQRTLRFDPLVGGIVQHAAPAEPGPESAWLVRRETVELLRFLAAAAVSQPPSLTVYPIEVLQRGARLLGAYIRHVLGEEPPTQVLVLGRIRP
jgi:recombinational DNA repair protein (RecF pathway)